MDGREDWPGLAPTKGLLSECDNGGCSVRGVDGIAAVVLVTGLLDARTESRGGLATAESLRSSRSELGSCPWRGTRGRIHRRT